MPTRKSCLGMRIGVVIACTELLPHVGVKRVRYFWGKNRGKWKGWQPPGIESRTPASALQLSYDDQSTNQPSQCSTYTAQVGLKCLSVTWQPLSMCHQISETIFASKTSNSLYSTMRQEFCAFRLRKPFSRRREFSGRPLMEWLTNVWCCDHSAKKWGLLGPSCHDAKQHPSYPKML